MNLSNILEKILSVYISEISFGVRFVDIRVFFPAINLVFTILNISAFVKVLVTSVPKSSITSKSASNKRSY